MKIIDLFEGKGTKEQAGYISRPKNGEKCINCTMWRDPNKCTAVAGDISPNGWCEWYAGGAYGKRGKRVNEAEGLGLTIFDIDETLMRTTAKIKVVKDGKVIRSLTNQEFNNYKLQPGEQFDFGEFKNSEKFRRESQPIAPMIAKLKAILSNAGNSKVIMLTARADFDDKETFLNTFRDLGIDMSRVHVHRAGNLPGNPAENKAVWIRKYLDTGKYSRVRLYDDSMGNIKMFNALAKEYPNVKFFPYLVTHDGGIKTVREDGRIVKGVNTTVDVGPDEIKTQAAKFGNTVDRDGRPPTLSKKVKGSTTNVLHNLGLSENQEPRYTAREWAIIQGGHSLEDLEVKTKLFDFDKY